VIAALVDDNEVTLKRLVKEKGRMVLRAANPRYPDLAPRKIETQGVMVGVIRRA
jgi:repressor LexA